MSEVREMPSEELTFKFRRDGRRYLSEGMVTTRR